MVQVGSLRSRWLVYCKGWFALSAEVGCLTGLLTLGCLTLTFGRGWLGGMTCARRPGGIRSRSALDDVGVKWKMALTMPLPMGDTLRV